MEGLNGDKKAGARRTYNSCSGRVMKRRYKFNPQWRSRNSFVSVVCKLGSDGDPKDTTDHSEDGSKDEN